MKRRPLGRISMTIPADVLRQADLLARRWNRSRSWVITEAIRRLAKEPATSPVEFMLVAEPSVPPYGATAVAEGRLAQLERNLALSPGERLRQAEALVALGRAARPRRPRKQIIGFETLEDFALWKKARRAGA